MSAERSQGEYPEGLAHNIVDGAIAIELARAKLMAPGSYPNDPSLVDYRVKPHTLREWRHGRRGVPRWALDLISSKLMALSAESHKLADVVRSATPGPGRTGAAGKQALNRYRAAQALKKNLPNP